jgi:hypothetical protein
MKIYRYFDESKLEVGAGLPLGVPARDLTEDEYREFPEHVRASIDAWSVFWKTKPKASKETAEPEPEPTDEPPPAEEDVT